MSPKMEYWTHPKDSSFKIPKLGFGTYGLKGESCLSAVQSALDLGLRHIDTAVIYENEAEVGEALKSSLIPRKEVFLTTKLWLDCLDKKGVGRSLHESLKKLQTDYVDLLLIHWPNPKVNLSESLGVMKELQKEKKLRFIGVSNFPLLLLKKAKQICPELVTNQVEYHPLLSQKALLDFVNEAGDIFLTAYSPLIRGKAIQIQQVLHIAEKHNKTPFQIALKWLIEQENVTVIFKTERRERILENMQIFDFKLDREDRKRLFRLNHNKQRLINPPFAPQWDE